ncbi:hypothetical protein C8F01DRAFT_363203 [Mycena amicta]|nr:hypothetical protein C8F01DRAFT_363203 [Mycena amicta]
MTHLTSGQRYKVSQKLTSSQMSSQRIVSIIGATGLQGSSVIKALLKDGTFLPRAISRNPASNASNELRAAGAQVVQGDSLDKSSLVRALEGSEGVFAVTVPMFRLGDDTGKDEEVQGKNIVDAAKEVGVKFFILSSQPSIARLTNGKYTEAKSYEQKAIVEEYLRASGLAHAAVHLGLFLENFWRFGALKKSASETSSHTLTFPIVTSSTNQSFTWVERDLPKVVLALLKGYNSADPQKRALVNRGVPFPVVTTRLSFGELTETVSKAIGAPVSFVSASPIGLPAADEMWFGNKELDGMFADIPVPNPDLTRLGVQLGSVHEFMQEELKLRFGVEDK